MSTSTGAPLNLNKFETSDDIVTALTTLFNQNMDKLNQSNTGVKTWAPSTVYNKGDIVLHKWDANKVLFATVSHTSSTASTESAWNDGDGSKWLSMSSNVYITDPAASEFLPQGTVTTDGGQIKRARVNTYPGKASYAQDMDLLTSRVVRWTPNTHYNVGDMFIVSSPSLTVNNYTVGLNNVVFLVRTAFTSGSNFAASDNAISSNYDIINPEKYVAFGNSIPVPNMKARIIRQGLHITLDIYTNETSGIRNNGGSWIPANEKLPQVFTPADGSRVFFEAYISRDDGQIFQIAPDGGMMFWTPRGDTGDRSWFHGSTAYDGQASDLIWPAFTPVN